LAKIVTIRDTWAKSSAAKRARIQGTQMPLLIANLFRLPPSTSVSAPDKAARADRLAELERLLAEIAAPRPDDGEHSRHPAHDGDGTWCRQDHPASRLPEQAA
jgi:hypothetical protein